MPHNIILLLSDGKSRESFGLSYLEKNLVPIKFINYKRKINKEGYFHSINEHYDECLEDIVFELNQLKPRSYFYNPTFIYDLFESLNAFVSSFSSEEKILATEVIITIWDELTSDVFVDYEDVFCFLFSSVRLLNKLKSEKKLCFSNDDPKKHITKILSLNPSYFIKNYLECFDFKQFEKHKKNAEFSVLKNKNNFEVDNDIFLSEKFSEFSLKEENFSKPYFWRIKKMKHLEEFKCLELKNGMFLYGFELPKEKDEFSIFSENKKVQ